MSDIVANSVSELLRIARETELRIKEMPWFRGHSDSAWSLVPTAHRCHPALETQFAQQFRLRAPAYGSCPPHQDYAGWLPFMRHYGLPTRLLDWSESLLVAVYFATELPDRDGSLWILSPGQLNMLSIGPFIPFLHDSRVQPLTFEAFGLCPDEPVSHCFSVVAPRDNPRIAAQLGNFTIHGTREALDQQALRDRFLVEVRIPASSKLPLRTELGLLGVRRSTLFPDFANLAGELSGLVVENKSEG